MLAPETIGTLATVNIKIMAALLGNLGDKSSILES